MQTSLAAVNLITAFEGYSPDAYICPGGKWTIGAGLTRYRDGEPVQPGDTIGHVEAEEELFHYIRNEVEPALDDIFPGAMLDLGTRDALASFIYNIGPDWEGAWPTLKRRVDEGDKDAICDQLLEYCYSNGKKLLGLYRRRLAEACMVQGWDWEGTQTATWDAHWRDFAPEPDALDIPKMPSRAPAPVPPPPRVDPYEEPAPMPAPRPVKRPPQPYRDYDPAAEPKDIALSKRVHGLWLVMTGWFTIGLQMVAELPVIGEIAALSPLKAENVHTSIMIVGAGLLLAWYGKVKAKGPLR
ncbi:MAG: lysozyme [Pseudomonadota bacterium]